MPTRGDERYLIDMPIYNKQKSLWPTWGKKLPPTTTIERTKLANNSQEVGTGSGVKQAM